MGCIGSITVEWFLREGSVGCQGGRLGKWGRSVARMVMGLTARYSSLPLVL